MQNIAGWSAPAESQVLRVLPNLPSKPDIPQVNPYGVEVDRFTVLLEAPADTEEYGGACSEYTFDVTVRNTTANGTVVVNQSGVPVGEFIVDNLLHTTNYSVVIRPRNQAGWGPPSETIQVLTNSSLDLTYLHEPHNFVFS